jgi:hypothetical protein
VVAAFQDKFVARLMVALKREIKRLSASNAIISLDMAKLGDEEGAAATVIAPASEDAHEAQAARKSEKVGRCRLAPVPRGLSMMQQSPRCSQ